jgi:hypothetical protein
MLIQKKVEFNGWQNCIRLSNNEIELVITTDIGPRISRFGYISEQNMFAEIPGQQGGQGEDEWVLRGGHRFWIAPEIKPDTYELDNSPIVAEEIDGGIKTIQPAGSILGISKSMEITLSSESNSVNIIHTLRNEGNQARDVAPWAPTVMAPNGMAVIPMPEFIAHTEKVLHNQEWSLWGYTDFSDSRWTLGPRYVFFRQDPAKGPNKLGIAHREGWVVYLLDEFMFVKYFEYKDGAVYPDGGVNFETFSNEDMLELESLAPLGNLGVGETASLVEQWSLHRGIPHCETAEDIDKYVLPLLNT